MCVEGGVGLFFLRGKAQPVGVLTKLVSRSGSGTTSAVSFSGARCSSSACTRSNCRGRDGGGTTWSASAAATFRTFAVGRTTIALRLSRASKYTGIDSMEPWDARRRRRLEGWAFNHMLSHHQTPLTHTHSHLATKQSRARR